MTSLVTVRSLCVVLCLAGMATAQEPPPLEPPDLEPSRAAAPQNPPETAPKPSSPKAAAPKPAAPAPPQTTPATNPRPPQSRPMLAIPGVTAPAARTRPTVRPQLQPAAPPQTAIPPFSTLIESPPVRSEVPVNRRPSPSNGLPPIDALPGASPSDAIHLTLEPLRDGPTLERPPSGTPAARPIPRQPRGPGMTDQPLDERESSAPRPAPRRAPGMLGRFFGYPQPQPQPARGPAPTTSRDASRRDLDSKPDSADLAAKRRIERQIRDTLGDRVSNVEVRITGRNAVVVAQPSRFWFRRSVRRSLETLPALEGYRARIELRE